MKSWKSSSLLTISTHCDTGKFYFFLFVQLCWLFFIAILITICICSYRGFTICTLFNHHWAKTGRYSLWCFLYTRKPWSCINFDWIDLITLVGIWLTLLTQWPSSRWRHFLFKKGFLILFVSSNESFRPDYVLATPDLYDTWCTENNINAESRNGFLVNNISSVCDIYDNIRFNLSLRNTVRFQ